MNQEHPFKTQNAILAFSLYVAGIPFASDDDGPPVPFTNIYDADTLRGISERRKAQGKPGYDGMTLEDSIRQAVRDGEKGDFSYNFKRDDRLEELLEAFDNQGRRIKESDESAADAIESLTDQYSVGRIDRSEFLLRMTSLILRARKLFIDDWKNVVPIVRVPNSGSPVTTTNDRGEKVVKKPGFRLMSLNASKETREKLGL